MLIGAGTVLEAEQAEVAGLTMKRGLGLGSAKAEPRLVAQRRFDALAERATAFLRIAAQAPRTT